MTGLRGPGYGLVTEYRVDYLPMLLFPKPVKRIKVRKPLKRGKKKLAARRKFKGFDNITKHYRRRYTDYQVMCQAEVCRQKRLANPTPAELEMSSILTILGIKHERERIILNADRFVLIDIFVPSVNLAIELDGNVHRHQQQYDHERSMWLARQYSIKTVRFFNAEVHSGAAQTRIKQTLGIV